MGHDLKFKMAAMPIYSKNHSNDFLPQNYQAYKADILQEAYGTPLYIKQLKSFRSDYKQTLIGWGKVWKNDAKFPIHEPFELES